MNEKKISVEEAFEVIQNHVKEQVDKNIEHSNIFLALGCSEEWESNFMNNISEIMNPIHTVPKISRSIQLCFEQASSIEEALSLMYTYVHTYAKLTCKK